MMTLTYNQLKRLVLEAKREEMTVDNDHVIDLDKVRDGSAKKLQKLLESIQGAKLNLEEIESLHKELSKITVDALHDRVKAKKEVSDAKTHEKKTDFADKAVKEFVAQAGEFTAGDRFFFKVKDNVDGLEEELGIILQSKSTPYSDVKKYGALLKLFEDKGVMEANPLFATLGSGLKTTLDSAVQAARAAGYDIPDEETTWSASMYTRRGGKFSRVNEGFKDWIVNGWTKIRRWFADKFMPKYERDVEEFKDDLTEADDIVSKAREAIREFEYNFGGQSAMLQESRRRLLRRTRR